MHTQLILDLTITPDRVSDLTTARGVVHPIKAGCGEKLLAVESISVRLD